MRVASSFHFTYLIMIRPAAVVRGLAPARPQPQAGCQPATPAALVSAGWCVGRDLITRAALLPRALSVCVPAGVASVAAAGQNSTHAAFPELDRAGCSLVVWVGAFRCRPGNLPLLREPAASPSAMDVLVPLTQVYF
jgi:hypothetical protein